MKPLLIPLAVTWLAQEKIKSAKNKGQFHAKKKKRKKKALNMYNIRDTGEHNGLLQKQIKCGNMRNKGKRKQGETN